MIRLYSALAVAAVILAMAGALWWQGARLDAERARREASEQAVADLQAAGQAKEQALADLRADMAARDAALAERDRQVAEISQQHAAAQRALREARRNDPIVQAWADAPIPGAVLDLLRQ